MLHEGLLLLLINSQWSHVKAAGPDSQLPNCHIMRGNAAFKGDESYEEHNQFLTHPLIISDHQFFFIQPCYHVRPRTTVSLKPRSSEP